MQNKFKILSFAGSLRKDSINKKLAKWASNELENSNFTVTYIDIADFPLSVYDQDITKFPEEAKKLANLMEEHQVWLIASPEYNYSIPGVLKNLIDFVSRAPDNSPNTKIFANKVVGLLSASPSNFGGARGLRTLREILSSLGCIVVPNQACITNSFSAFDEKNNLMHEFDQKLVRNVLDQLTAMAVKLV